jgi:hypothetical protein
MRIFPVLLSILALSAIGVLAKTVPVPGEGASITIPDDWSVLDRPHLAFVAAAPGETTALAIVIAPYTSPKWVNDPIYILEMQDAILKRALKNRATVKIIDSGAKAINGVPTAYVQVEQTFSGNRIIYSQEYDIAANGKLYALNFDTRDTFVAPALEKIADSFRFDKPPAFPAPVDYMRQRIEEVAATVVAFMLFVALLVWISKAIGSRRG